MGAKLKLPDGPPALYVIPRFSPRELEFIKLRYGQTRGFKEIMHMMNASLRNVKRLGAIIHAKLAVYVGVGEGNNGVIQATKRLIKLGIISTEE